MYLIYVSRAAIICFPLCQDATFKKAEQLIVTAGKSAKSAPTKQATPIRTVCKKSLLLFNNPSMRQITFLRLHQTRLQLDLASWLWNLLSYQQFLAADSPNGGQYYNKQAPTVIT